MLKKILATALAAAMIFGLANMAFAAPVFPDTAGVENEADIAKLKALGIVKGDDLGNFNPNNPINRAEFTTMVVRMLGLETAASYLNSPPAFPDVTAAFSWAYGYINVATGRGLIKGYEDGTFRPGANVTQAEALTILIRALGYTDNLPGNWPIDYVMKGAELGIIDTGFATNVAATRALIAALVVNTLDEDLVKEDPDAVGNFLDKYSSPRSLYQDAFKATLTDDTGVLTSYSSSSKKITLDETTDYNYATGLAIYGGDSLADLVGEHVVVTFNKDNKVCYIAVTTENTVVGEITAVNTSKSTVTVGGVAYEVESDAVVIKNGAELPGTIASKLVEVEDADAKLFVEDGKVYRIVASILDESGTLSAKITEVKSGKVTYKIDVGTGTPLELDEDCVIVRNGTSATFADLKAGDSLEWAYDTDDALVTYIDAFSNVLEGYTLVSLRSTSAGTVATLEKDGVEVEYTIAKGSNYKTSYLTGGVAVSALDVDTDYRVMLNRSGLIVCFAPATTEGVDTDGDVLEVVAKYMSGTSSSRKYNLELSDGTVVILNDVFSFTTRNVFVNGINRNDGGADDLDTAKDLYNAISVGDLIVADTSGATATFEVYDSSLTGHIKYAAGVFTLHDGTVEYNFVATWSADATFNGTRVSASDIASLLTAYDPDVTATIEFSGKKSGSNPIVSTIAVEDFSDTDAVTGVSVTSISVSGHKYTIHYASSDGTIDNFVINDDRECVAVRDDEDATLADIEIGDIVFFSPAVTIGSDTADVFVKAVLDEESPVIDDTTLTATWDATDKELTVEFELDLSENDYPDADAPAVVYVWVGTTLYEFEDPEISYGTGGWTVVLDLDAKPSSVTVQVEDFAGNESAVETVTVS